MVTVLMYVAYTAYVLAALLMIGAVLLQEGKGGGLSALGGTPAESAFGASNPIRRMTVVLSIVFFLLAGFLSYVSSRTRLRFEPPKAQSAQSAATQGGQASPAETAEKTQPGSQAPAAAATPEASPAAAQAPAGVPGAATPPGADARPEGQGK